MATVPDNLTTVQNAIPVSASPLTLTEPDDRPYGPTNAELAEAEAEIARMRYEEEHAELLQRVLYLDHQNGKLTRELLALTREHYTVKAQRDALVAARVELQPDDLDVRLPFDEMCSLQASWYRSLGTTFGSGAARLWDQTAADAQSLKATSWTELEVRTEVMQRDRTVRLIDLGHSAAPQCDCYRKY